MYKRAIIIGGGASIPNDFDWSLLKNEFTFGINYIYRLMEPTIHVFDNDGVYNAVKKERPDLKSIKISHHCTKPDVNYIPPSNQYYGKDSLRRRQVYCSTLTGIYTLNIASCLPFEEIYLMGYDLTKTDGRVHFKSLKHTQESMQPYHQTHRFKVFKNLDNVFNVSPNSAIQEFPKMDYSRFYEILNNKQEVNQDEAREWLRKQIVR